VILPKNNKAGATVTIRWKENKDGSTSPVTTGWVKKKQLTAAQSSSKMFLSGEKKRRQKYKEFKLALTEHLNAVA